MKSNLSQSSVNFLRARKRTCLPPISYPTLTKLYNKSSNEILTEMLTENFQLKKFLNDKRMQEKYDWIVSMTKLLEKMTECTESRERMAMIFEQLPNTLYLEGIYDAVRNVNPDTKQLNINLITSVLRVSNMFLSMIPYSADGLIKIFERIELQFSKNATDTPVSASL